MDQLHPKVADRRFIRKQMLANRNFHRVDAHLNRLSDQEHLPALQEYMRSANIELLELDQTAPLRGRATIFPDISFMHLSVPKATFRWNRDQGSLDRAFVILVRHGQVEVETEGPVLRRHPTAFLVTPHEHPVIIRVTEPDTEFVAIGIPANYLSGTITEDEAAISLPSGPVPMPLLAPLYAFAIGFCALSVHDAAGASPLLTAAREIIRSTLRLIIEPADPDTQSLYSLAFRTILDEYADPSFNIGVLARRLGVSTRTLQATFKTAETTVSSSLRDVRRAAAEKIMQEQPRLAKLKVASLVGFGSVDALNRALRAV